MPLGELPINGFSIPQHAPPYPIDRFQFKLSLLAIEYHTTAAAARDILPNNLEIEDEPLCRSSVFNYHMSTVGAYTEYVHQIEVKWKGQKYDYVVTLILDNESAIYAGREQWGFPKVQGEVNLNVKTGSSHMTASVYRPKSQHVVQLGFTPEARHPVPDNTDGSKQALTLRVIPAVKQGAPPDIKEMVSSHMDISGGDLWVGKGSVAFPVQSDWNPFPKMPVTKVGNAFYWENADATLALRGVWKL